MNFKEIVDLPKWRPLAPCPNPFVTGVPLICDLRNNDDRHPFIYQIFSTSQFNRYSVKNDEWETIAGTIGGAIAAGCSGTFVPSQGPRGTVGASPDASTIVISTPLPSSVGSNRLANRGDGRGFKIRIIGNSGGSSGKTEERIMVSNTGGNTGTTTPTITLDSPLSFIPLNGDHYEFLSGKLFLIGSGTTTAGIFTAYDIATESSSFPTLSITNLPTPIGATTQFPESWMYSLDELYVPYNQLPGFGFLGLLTATATGADSLTGQAAGGDASVLANEYRNFQIRIVTDTGTPTAAGQRAIISSHTAGPNPVYTLASPWGVQPSANAVYVIEQTGDRILFWNAQNTTTFTYTISTDTWDAGVTFTTRVTALAAGAILMPSFGIVPDPQKNARQSFIFNTRSNSTDIFDIAGGPTGSSASGISVGGRIILGVGTGSSGIYEPVTMQGKYTYINQLATQRFYRFDALNRVYEPSTFLRIPITQSIAQAGVRMASAHFQDGSTKLAFIIHAHPSDTTMHQLTVYR